MEKFAKITHFIIYIPTKHIIYFTSHLCLITIYDGKKCPNIATMGDFWAICVT